MVIVNAGKRETGRDFSNEGLTGTIIGAAIQVHRTLGPGFLESIYERALCVEFETQRPVSVLYRGQVVGEHRIDLLVENEILVELKAARAIEPIHFAVVRSYLKALDLGSALVFNFATTPLTIRRVDLENPSSDVV